MEPPVDADDPFRRVNYRRLIAWQPRIAREAPFLERLLHGAPARSLIDLGCGTGEHARYLAESGVAVLGVDRSQAQIDQARDYEDSVAPGNPAFLLGDLTALPALTQRRFGAALCLGNALPYLEDADLDAALHGIAQVLLEGGRLAVQLLNYQRIREQQVRHLPLNVRADPDDPHAEIVFLRLMTVDGPDHIRFYPTTLHLRPGADPPLSIHHVREVRLRAWTWPELRPRLAAAGFGNCECFGDMAGAPFDAATSTDLIFIARRQA